MYFVAFDLGLPFPIRVPLIVVEVSIFPSIKYITTALTEPFWAILCLGFG